MTNAQYRLFEELADKRLEAIEDGADYSETEKEALEDIYSGTLRWISEISDTRLDALIEGTEDASAFEPQFKPLVHKLNRFKDNRNYIDAFEGGYILDNSSNYADYMDAREAVAW